MRGEKILSIEVMADQQVDLRCGSLTMTPCLMDVHTHQHAHAGMMPVCPTQSTCEEGEYRPLRRWQTSKCPCATAALRSRSSMALIDMHVHHHAHAGLMLCLRCAVYVRGGRIQTIEALADQQVDLRYGSLTITPGLIDMHTHMDEPGREAWEGVASTLSNACPSWAMQQ